MFHTVGASFQLRFSFYFWHSARNNSKRLPSYVCINRCIYFTNLHFYLSPIR
ncbi:hypothetical protein BMB171_C0783 [Bacillus thuringiensis BMB171]|nr:hypothetical protein BMB171_C0783 [Bacillus thuringiensis BMB171]